MRLLFTLLLFVALSGVLRGNVVEPAPSFGFKGARGKATSLRSLRGRPVVLLIAPSAGSKEFRTQVKRITKVYRFFETRKVALVAAVADGGARVESTAPFIIVNGASDVAAQYGVRPGTYGLFVIGSDGNIDLRTQRVLSAQRLIDVIDNAEPVQAARQS
jgi:hypothetical protein